MEIEIGSLNISPRGESQTLRTKTKPNPITSPYTNDSVFFPIPIMSEKSCRLYGVYG